jgi:hypothetical protein
MQPVPACFVDGLDGIAAYTETVAHTYVCDLVHCVFSTKFRRNLIKPEIQSDIWSFLGGIARKNKFKALIDRRHRKSRAHPVVVARRYAVSEGAAIDQGVSSRWMNETHTKGFAWQEGYGAFTVGVSQKANTIAYIQSQSEHHRKRSFEEEFIAFLKKHNVEYDPQYVWG